MERKRDRKVTRAARELEGIQDTQADQALKVLSPPTWEHEIHLEVEYATPDLSPSQLQATGRDASEDQHRRLDSSMHKLTKLNLTHLPSYFSYPLLVFSLVLLGILWLKFCFFYFFTLPINDVSNVNFVACTTTHVGENLPGWCASEPCTMVVKKRRKNVA